MRKLSLLSLTISVIVCLSFSAEASGWRFCVAGDFSGHRLFVTPLFTLDQDRSELEQRFSMALAAQDLIVSNVQCPVAVGSKTEALNNRQKAITFGQTLHYSVSLAPLPSGALAAREPEAREIDFKSQ